MVLDMAISSGDSAHDEQSEQLSVCVLPQCGVDVANIYWILTALSAPLKTCSPSAAMSEDYFQRINILLKYLGKLLSSSTTTRLPKGKFFLMESGCLWNPDRGADGFEDSSSDEGSGTYSE